MKEDSPASAWSQMPVEISKMQQAGVDSVFLVTNFITALQFVNAADSQGFRPKYFVSDLGSLMAAGLVRSIPPSFDRAITFSQSLQPTTTDPPPNKKCLDTYNANASGRDVANVAEDGGGLTLICWTVTVFEAAADLTGARLTRAGMAQAFQRLVIVPPHVQSGSFRSGKTDYADFLRPLEYSRTCKSYEPVGPSRRGRY